MKQLTAYWQSLKPQEQRLLMLAGGVFAVFIFVMGIWRPLNNAVADGQKAVASQQSLLAFVQSSIGTLQQSAPTANRAPVNLSQLVNNTSRQYNIAISKMQPKDNSIRLTLEAADFNQLMRWLDVLTQQHGVSIANLDVSQDTKPGFVRVSRLVLEN